MEKVWKMIKSLFFQSYKCLISDFVFPLVQSHSISPVAKTFHHTMRSFITLLVTVRLQCIMKKAWFLCFSRSLLITYCNLESGKKNIVLEKVLNFGSKNLYKPCFTVLCITLYSFAQKLNVTGLGQKENYQRSHHQNEKMKHVRGKRPSRKESPVHLKMKK